GKPFMLRQGGNCPHFNISHSNRYVVCAFVVSGLSELTSKFKEKTIDIYKLLNSNRPFWEMQNTLTSTNLRITSAPLLF
ncbi:MAG: phosphopantetheinyl transferase, partial [Reinekea sp.]